MVEFFRDVYINNKETKYQVSDKGNVRNKYTKQILRPVKDAKGYLRVCLTLEKSKKYTAKIHRLVAYAFIPNPESKPTVNHLDGIHDNNHVSNLEWATYQEQADHANRIGLIKERLSCEDSPTSIYSNETIHCVCKLLEENNLRQSQISKMTGVSRDTINKIRKGKEWINISRLYNIDTSDKLKSYSNELKRRISKLLDNGYTAREIIDILKLPVETASFSLVYNVKYGSRDKWFND